MDFTELKKKLSTKTVLVYGDHYLDRQGIGKWQGFSREEEELPIFRMSEEFYNPGGAGNLACNFQALGVHTKVVGIWGTDKDWNRKILEYEFQKRGIDTSSMIAGGKTPKFEKCYFKSGVHVVRMDVDPEDLSPTVVQQCEDKLRQLFDKEDFDYLAVADYDETNRGVCFPRALELLATCKTPKFGTSRARIAQLKGFDFLILNRKELIEQIGRPEETMNLRAAFLMAVANAQGIVMTLSGQGVELFHREDRKADISDPRPLQSIRVPSSPITGTIDPCGCGDTFYATFVAVLSVGYGVKEAARLGNAAARVVVKKLYGAATPTLQEVEHDYQEMYGSNV